MAREKHQQSSLNTAGTMREISDKSPKILFIKKLWKYSRNWFLLIAGIISIVTVFEDTWRVASIVKSSLWNAAAGAYYKSGWGTHLLVNKLIQDYYPTAEICEKRVQWFDSDNDGVKSDLIVEFKECLNRSEKNLLKQHITLSQPIDPWAAAIFKSSNWNFYLVGEFAINGEPFQKTQTKGPFIIRMETPHWTQYQINVYVLNGNRIIPKGKIETDDEVEFRDELINQPATLYIRGHESFAWFDFLSERAELKQKTTQSLIDAVTITNREFTKVLRPTEQGYVIGEDPLSLEEVSTEGLCGLYQGNINIPSISRITTTMDCEFKGFIKIDSIFDEYVLREITQPGIIECIMSRGSSSIGAGAKKFRLVVNGQDFLSRYVNKGN